MKLQNQSARRFVRLGCAALALALGVGAVPFLRGWAAEETADHADAAVSPADLSVVSPADLSDASPDAATGAKETVEPKVYSSDSITATFEDGVLTFTGSGTLAKADVQAAISGINQKTIATINIGGGITAIGDSAFFSMGGTPDGDTTLNIGDSVQTIGNGAFGQFYDLDHVNIGSGVTTIGSTAFGSCSAVTSFALPDSVTTIGFRAFTNCFTAASITLGSNVTYIGGEAFTYCNSLTAITIPASVTRIDNALLAYCNVLTDVTFECTSFDLYGKFISNKKGIHIHLPCEHFNISRTVINDDNKDTYFGSNAVLDIPETQTETVNAVAATCLEGGYSGDRVCAACGTVLEEGGAIDALGHDWGDWAVTKAPTDTEDGEETRVCGRDDSHTETRSVKYVFTGDSSFRWVRGSAEGMTVIVKNVGENADDSTTYDRFKSVSIDGEPCADFAKVPGSVKITLSPDALQALDKGEHTVKVELDLGIAVISVEHSFTVAAPASTDTPATGESIALVVCSAVLMLLAACGVGYAVKRRAAVSL